MPYFGLRGPIAAALTLTVVGLAIAPAATASPAGPTGADLAATAQSAADAANQAFIIADWAGVTSNADAFDVAYDALVALRDDAQAEFDAAKDVRRNTGSVLNDAKDTLAAARVVLDDAKGALDDAKDALDDAKDALDDAEAAVAVAEQAVLDAQADVALKESALTQANTDLGAAEDNYDDAVAAFNAPISPVNGIDVGTIAGLVDYRDGLQTTVDNLPACAGNLGQRIACGIAQAIQRGLLTAANAAVDGVNGEALQANVATTAGELATAQGNVTTAEGELGDAQTALGIAEQGVIDANTAVTDAENAVADARDAKRAAKTAVDDARDALNEARDALNEARDAHDLAVADVVANKANRNALNGLINSLAQAKQDVADRRADLVDLDTVMAQTTISLADLAGEVKAGDSVVLPFTITNSQLFDLSDATVAVTTPAGITPVCDLAADSVVPAGATLTCAADYQVSATDVLNGSVTVTVELTGWVPLGPGNPRGMAVTRTQVTVTQSTVIMVAKLTPVAVVTPATEAAPTADVTPTPISAELSETGPSDTFGSITDAAILLMVGVGLVIVARRRSLFQK